MLLRELGHATLELFTEKLLQRVPLLSGGLRQQGRMARRMGTIRLFAAHRLTGAGCRLVRFLARFCERASRPSEDTKSAEAMLGGLPGATGDSVAV